MKDKHDGSGICAECGYGGGASRYVKWDEWNKRHICSVCIADEAIPILLSLLDEGMFEDLLPTPFMLEVGALNENVDLDLHNPDGLLYSDNGIIWSATQ